MTDEELAKIAFDAFYRLDGTQAQEIEEASRSWRERFYEVALAMREAMATTSDGDPNPNDDAYLTFAVKNVTRNGWTVAFSYEDLMNGVQEGYRCILTRHGHVGISPLCPSLVEAIRLARQEVNA